MALPLIQAAWALAEFAPKLIGLLKGPKAEEAAATVVNAAQVLTGTATPDDAVAAVRLDPALQLQFQQHVADNELRWAELFLQDMDSARKRDLQIRLAGINNYRADLLVGIALIGVVSITALLVNVGSELDDVVKGFVISVGTLLAQKVGTAFDFEFGSSRSSWMKTIFKE